MTLEPQLRNAQARAFDEREAVDIRLAPLSQHDDEYKELEARWIDLDSMYAILLLLLEGQENGNSPDGREVRSWLVCPAGPSQDLADAPSAVIAPCGCGGTRLAAELRFKGWQDEGDALNFVRYEFCLDCCACACVAKG